MRRRRFLAFAAILTLCATTASWAASEELNHRLRRIFASNAFSAKRFGPARWIRGGAAFTTLESSASVPGSRDIVENTTATGVKTILVKADQLKPPKSDKALVIEDYIWDRDLARLLIFTNSEKVWRTNSRGDYWLLDRKAGTLKKLGGSDAPEKSLMFAKFSPDGSRVAYVRANNIYVENLATGAITQLTKDGSDTIVNGTSDWVYEEELNLRDAYRWSPDSKRIAFWQFDMSGVEHFTLINNTDALYPKITRIPYPKAGQKNSAVRVGVIPADASAAPVWFQIPGDPRDNYIFRMAWVDANEVAIGQLNRKQNVATIYVADPATGAAKAIFKDEDETWVDVPEGAGAGLDEEGFDWLNNRKAFLWVSERDGWRRAYAVPRDGSAPAVVTAGQGDLIRVLQLDQDARWLYYTASPGNATQRYLYRAPVGQSGAGVQLTPKEQIGTHSYNISPDGKWAFHTFSRFDQPPVIDLVSLPEHTRIRILEDNATLRANAAGVTDPPVEFVQVRIGDGAIIDGYLLRPKNFDPAKKYPVIVHVYGEPAGALVVDQWTGPSALFHRALAEEGYIIACFDNRGTPAPKGRAWRKSIYGAVGVLSAKDQTEAIQSLARQRSYIDLNRIGVWGWSGGGSNTLNMMFRSPDVYKVGVSVAPVPDQKLYDTIYQERYMGLPRPGENEDGYRIGSPINYAEGLRGKLLIIHGTGDDNVHYQGAEKLVNRLIELGKQFDFMAYPNRSHSISEGSGTSLHVYSLIARYFTEHLPAGPR